MTRELGKEAIGSSMQVSQDDKIYCIAGKFGGEKAW